MRLAILLAMAFFPKLVLANQVKDCAVLLEVADLFLEKSKFAASSDAALRVLIEKNIRKKIAEFERASGRSLDQREIQKLIRRREAGLKVEASEEKANEDTARAREEDAGLGWALTPVLVKNEILRESFLLEPSNVKVLVDKAGKARLLYEVEEAAAKERGYHIADIGTGKDVYLGNRIDSVEFYKGSKGEAIITVPWAPGVNDAKIEIRNSKTGKKLNSFHLPSLIPNFRKFVGQVQAYPYEKANGDMSILFVWSMGMNKSTVVFEIDPSLGSVREVADLGSEYRIYRSADYKRIYSYQLSDIKVVSKSSVFKRIVVSDLLAERTIFEKEIEFSSASNANIFKAREVAFSETSKGKPYLTLSYYGSDELVIYDIAGNKSQTYKRDPGDNSGGMFAEGKDGALYFLQKLSGDRSEQTVIDLTSRKSEVWNLGKFSGIEFSAVIHVEKYGAVAIYSAHLGSQYSTGEKRGLIGLLLSQPGSGASAVDITNFDMGSLEGTFADDHKRVFGIFRNCDFGNKNNFKLIQLYGPRGRLP